MSVPLTLSVDRFEGDGHSIVVLLTDDGEAVNVPRSLLPPDLKPGDVLTLSIEHDREATRKLAEETGRVQRKLAQGDTGGDIRL
jgi:citrate lyase alpha subunit